jgi:membrane protease YdiL (CAAX protease family)
MDERTNASSEEQAGSNPGESPSSVQAPTPDFAVQPSYVKTVFLGPEGLRAGWGFAFYVAMFYPLQFVASRWAGSLELGASGLWSMMLEEFAVLVAAVIPAVVLGRVERRHWGTYGLPVRQAFGKLFWVGAVWGFASITLLLGVMYGLRVFEVGSLAMHGARIVKFAAFWAGYFLLVGLFEDFLFRGYSQFTLNASDWFLAGSGCVVLCFWPGPFVEWGRAVAGTAGGGRDWIFLLFDVAAHGELVVCGGISYGMGLGRDVFLFGAG